MRNAWRSITFVSLLLASSTILFSQTASLHGIEAGDLNRKAQPCDDFYEFANGTWRANNPIPASMSRWSRRWQAGETAKDKLREIAEAAAAVKNAPRGSTEQIVGDYYGACMDESKVNARGMDPVKPWFARIDAAADVASLQPVIADLHDILVQVPFGFGGQQDPHKPALVLADIGASGLGLPDRDYYLKSEDRFKEAREKYVAHITSMFKLAGWDQQIAAAAAQTVLTMETKLATASIAGQRRAARSCRHRPQHDVRAVAGDGPAFRLGGIFQAQATAGGHRSQCGSAGIHAGI
jgi:putative endopeptidase